MALSYRYQMMPGMELIEKITPSSGNLQRELLYLPLHSLSDHIHTQDIIMCHEAMMHIVYSHVNYTGDSTLKTQDILDRIQESMISDSKWLYHKTIIQDILHNGSPAKYCIGKAGHITCKLSLIFVDSILYHTLNTSKHLQQWQAQSWDTISYCNKIHKKSYCLLYIYEQSLKLIIVDHEQISKVYYLDIGSQDLKKIYQEQHIIEYFDKDIYDYHLNDFVKHIITTSTQFFVTHLVRRIQECIGMQMVDCYCICDTANHFLKEQLTQTYSQSIGNTLIYLNYLPKLDNIYKGHLIDIGLHHIPDQDQ